MFAFFKSISKTEALLWIISSASIFLSAVLSGSMDYLSVISSLIGVSSLIFIAKGHYYGQALMIIFAVLYGIISIGQKYYGEAFTYLGMTAPSSFFTMIVWIKHPYKNSDTVEILNIPKLRLMLILVLTLIISASAYFLLEVLGNAQPEISTVSVATSFCASALMFFRSPYYALAYAANDIVLIILWVIASFSDYSCIPVAVCFIAFFLNDIYGFYSWNKMKALQNSD